MIEHHINLLSSQFQREQLEEETESSRHYPTSGYPSHLKCVCVGGGRYRYHCKIVGNHLFVCVSHAVISNR